MKTMYRLSASVVCLVIMITSAIWLFTMETAEFSEEVTETERQLPHTISNWSSGYIGDGSKRQFNIHTSDILVVLHIQKTGGSKFEGNLASKSLVEPRCRCDEGTSGPRCKCHNKAGLNWLFCRESVGWMCGVHPDWTEMTTCVGDWFRKKEGEVRERRFHYITLIREPVSRFLSEWRHRARGASWAVNLLCDGVKATEREVPPCHFDLTTELTLFNFMECKSNLAYNRQTRMIANLSLSHCYRLDSDLSHEKRREIMLASAKYNLEHVMSFFGLMEYQRETSLLFQIQFPGIRFEPDVFVRQKGTQGTSTLQELPTDDVTLISERNSLDVELYRFAKELFLQRLKQHNIQVESAENF